MKQGIHPDYHKVVFMDSATGYKFLSGSTKTTEETIEWEDGNTYPLIRVEISSDSHPFYTGKQKFTSSPASRSWWTAAVVWIASTRNTVLQTRIFHESYGFDRGFFILK